MQKKFALKNKTIVLLGVVNQSLIQYHN